jgi:hypothetical protein
MKVILSVPDEGYFERTWWRLFWAYMMKVILSVPNEGYFERTWWRLFWAYLMKVILSVPDEGYSERTWWRLFWSYLMKVIPETRGAHSIWYLRCYNFHWIDASTGGLLVPEGLIHPIVSASAMIWFIRYIFFIEIGVIIIKTKVLFPQA